MGYTARLEIYATKNGQRMTIVSLRGRVCHVANTTNSDRRDTVVSCTCKSGESQARLSQQGRCPVAPLRFVVFSSHCLARWDFSLGRTF